MSMHRLILHNDDIQDAGERLLSAGQVGLLNGWGVFSTLRVYDGVMFAWERHFARMQHDAEKMSVPFPADFTWMEERLYRLIEANQALNATLRVAVIRNRGGMFEGPDLRRDFDVIAFTTEVNAWGDTVRLGMVANARHAANEFAGVKYTSWAQNLTWYERAHQQGLDEMLLLNERGEIAECTSANIFAASGSEVWTPPLCSGCLPGVTRSLLLSEIDIAEARVVEKTLFPADLEAADEVFITSTTRELIPVVAVEGQRIRGGRTICDRLAHALRAYVSAYVSMKRRTVPI
jgi:branched-chain amino acid aminotransferase